MFLGELRALNGKLIQDVDQSEFDEIKQKPLKGFVSVQNHGKWIEFRNLKLRKVKSKCAVKLASSSR